MTVDATIHKILQEDLKPYKVPKGVRDVMVDKILAALNTPEKKKFGATVMTPEASMAADRQRSGKPSEFDPKPKII